MGYYLLANNHVVLIYLAKINLRLFSINLKTVHPVYFASSSILFYYQDRDIAFIISNDQRQVVFYCQCQAICSALTD